jgi:Asp-tRNA(Asn)/Glu-tRNA(Gln) amidotransferase A subunit family amidase
MVRSECHLIGRSSNFKADFVYVRNRTRKIKIKKKDEVVKGSPVCHRAVLETVEALRNAGHECVEIDSPDCAPTTTAA